MSTASAALPDCLYSVAQVRELDRIAIQELGIPGYSLMRRAAGFGYQTLQKHWPEAADIVVVCGGGNNAGDGYLLACRALADQKRISVVSASDPARLKGDAARAYADFRATGQAPVDFSPALIAGADVVVDALFGTGLNRAVSGPAAAIIAALNGRAGPILALDVPSGLNADSGNSMGRAVRATVTATFIGLKRGLFTGAGPECGGRIEFDRLAVPAEAYQRLGQPAAWRLDLEKLSAALTPRPCNSHKGDFGHVLVIGGDTGYAGAARLAAEAGARVGAGLVSVATRAAHAGLISAGRPELMAHGVETPAQLAPLIQRADVIAIGPGLGQGAWGRSLLARALESRRPLILDADALNLLAGEPRGDPGWILTPHPGEAARLLNTDSSAIQADRFAAIAALHQKYQGPVVLKGCGSLVIDAEARCHVSAAGNPGMATAGMGDVLGGVIAGLIAQGMAPGPAAQLGVCLHATAADRAVRGEGERGLLAGDLMPHLRRLVNRL